MRPVCAAFLILSVVWPVELKAQQVDGQQVRRAVQAGVRYIRKHQQNTGGWSAYPSYPGGATALCLLALINAGVPVDDSAIAEGLNNLARINNEQTYVVGLKAHVLAVADPDRFQPALREAVRWLSKAQLADGTWSYGMRLGRGDHSNTQFALLGLHEAARVGVRVPTTVWHRARINWIQTQCEDGGWGYRTRERSGYGSMTAAGVASLFICGNTLLTRSESSFVNGAAPGCGKYRQDPALARGVNWLAGHFSVETNPLRGGWHYYYLYGLERVGILTGQKHIGAFDWYRRGAQSLVARQHADGSWSQGTSIVDTAFAILFLAKGHRSLLFNKLQWAKTKDWNLDRNDIANLVSYIDDKLAQPVSWQVTRLDADLEEWLAAPILYLNGHKFPQFDEKADEKVREFIRQGGTLLAEACCGRRKFVDGFRQFTRRVFPDSPLRPLEPDHPVYHAYKEADQTFPLEGIDLGCRTSVIFSPKDLSCLWEQEGVPKLSEKAFLLGTNIAAYATGRQPLRDKLAVVTLASRDRPRQRPVRGALRIAQLVHRGDWRPDPHSLIQLAEFLNKNAGLDVVPASYPVDAADDALFDYPVLYMTGHFSFELADAQVAGLRTFLNRGGFLLADACCGRKAFDVSFKNLMARVLPAASLEPLGDAHPIVTGQLGFKLDRVRYRPAVLKETPNLDAVRLLGAPGAPGLDGRTAVVYSPYGLGCGWESHACFTCRGLTPEDSKRLATNVILYAISY